MSVGQFREFVGHAYWGLDKVLDALEQGTPEEFTSAPLTGLGSPRDILVHMLGFERFWSTQLVEGPMEVAGLDPAGFKSVGEVRAAWAPVRERWLSYLDARSDADLDAPITVRTPWGETFSAALRRMLSQFVQHQGQHRSELAAIVTALGHSPGEFDWWDYEAARDGEA